ncbi:MAG TPA: hypothetical protein VK447_10925 [Myxococcaceae bacterium]|nr:hypothetical protein [Myxococcaceae bacterium]
MPASPTVGFANMLPPLYAGWMKALLEGPVLDETQATCAACAMASHPGAWADERELAFKPNAKCCTYHPALPNFSVGMALADASAEAARGRAALERQIALRKGATPLALGPTKKAHEDFEREKVERFGRDRELLCPYYEDEGGGLCNIWRYRNSTCATYFCKFVRGAVGRIFWRDTLRPLLAAIERVLGQ